MVVSHDLASIFAIADYAIFLDATTRTMRAQGHPRELLEHSNDSLLREFLTRGEASAMPSAAPSLRNPDLNP